MKNRIDWTDERLGSSVYEDMASVLINRLHPQAKPFPNAAAARAAAAGRRSPSLRPCPTW